MDKEFMQGLVHMSLILLTIVFVISRMCACEEATHTKDITPYSVTTKQ